MGCHPNGFHLSTKKAWTIHFVCVELKTTIDGDTSNFSTPL